MVRFTEDKNGQVAAHSFEGETKRAAMLQGSADVLKRGLEQLDKLQQTCYHIRVGRNKVPLRRVANILSCKISA
jgi:cytoplasmic iron level regulating protein YaaA (DUF328/UPF0246 family)